MRFLQSTWSALAVAFLASSAPAADDVLSLYQTAPSSAPSTTPASAPSNSNPPITEMAAGFVEFFAPRFSAHEPVYFLYWPDSPDIKFQFSVKYKLFGLDDLPTPWPQDKDGLYIAYTQTSLWDISAPSKPFYDNSYKPEAFYQLSQSDPHWLAGMKRFDLQAGYQHESNGKSQPDSRSMNILYIRPIFTFGDPGSRTIDGKGYFITIAPRLFTYIGGLVDNKDIDDYRGHADLRIVAGQRQGFQLSTTARAGDDFEHGSIELDASIPIKLGRNPNVYLYAQYFLGYGEALIDYNESGSSFRVGIALVR